MFPGKKANGRSAHIAKGAEMPSLGKLRKSWLPENL